MSGRVSLVTGSSRGIGRGIALRLARDGAVVAVHDRTGGPEAHEVAETIKAAGGQVLVFAADLADAEQCRQLVRDVEARLGPIEVLVSNAGVNLTAEISDVDFAAYEAMRAINLDAPVHLVQAACGGMKSRGWGRIVMTSSLAGLGTATRGATFYAMTKAALNMLTKRLALDLGPHGITVNAVAPGVIETPLSTAAGVDYAAVAAGLMVRRVGQPEDVADAVAYFVSEGAGFVTAQVLAVDGGATHHLSPT